MTPESTATAVAPYAAELLTLWKRSHRDTHKAIIFRDGDQDQQRFCDALNTQLAVMGLKHPRTKKPLRAVVYNRNKLEIGKTDQRNEHFDILVSDRALERAFNLPAIKLIIFLKSTDDPITIRQCIGRGRRVIAYDVKYPQYLQSFCHVYVMPHHA